MPELPDGVSLHVVEQDYGPATKILPSVADFRGSDVPLIYCDDDRVASPEWASNLLDASKAHPEDCITISGWDIDRFGYAPKRKPEDLPRAEPMRSLYDVNYRFARLKQLVTDTVAGRKSVKPSRYRNFRREGYCDVMEGCGGVLVRSALIPERAFDIPAKIWPMDDVWLGGMVTYGGNKVWATNGFLPSGLQGANVDALCDATIEGLDRSGVYKESIEVMRRDFGVWGDT